MDEQTQTKLNLNTSVQELHGVSGRWGLAESLGGDGQDPESVADCLGEGVDGVGGLLQARSYDDPLDGAQGLLLNSIHHRAGILKKKKGFP